MTAGGPPALQIDEPNIDNLYLQGKFEFWAGNHIRGGAGRLRRSSVPDKVGAFRSHDLDEGPE